MFLPRRKTHEQYLQECKDKGYDPPIEDYINNRTKIGHKCKKGHIYKQSPNKHLHGHGCPICKGGIKYSVSGYNNMCKEKGYDLPTEPYINSSTPIKHKCKKGHIYKQRPTEHLKGIGCTTCGGTKKKTSKQYIQECKDKGYDLPIEDYKNNSTKIKHVCSKCNNVYEQLPSNHLRGQGCPLCAKEFRIRDRIGQTKRKTSKEYTQECKSKGYDLPAEYYVNAKTPIKHKCKKGHIYKQRPTDHVSHNGGCPICNESHGERYIRNYLDKNNIKYESQKKFKDLKDKTYLSYDFYLPDYNILIEYQGIQHYKPIEQFGGEGTFKKQQLHDKLKRQYAKENGYKLLELKYTLDSQELVNRYLNRRIK